MNGNFLGVDKKSINIKGGLLCPVTCENCIRVDRESVDSNGNPWCPSTGEHVKITEKRDCIKHSRVVFIAQQESSC